ncbi:unnamed protein product, partial [Symbiodinium pilosum]
YTGHCSCQYRKQQSSDGQLEISPSVQLLVACVLAVALLGSTTGPEGSLITDVDGYVHQFLIAALSPEDHRFFAAVSNRLDDFGQLLAWLLAGLSTLILLSTRGEGGLPLILSTPSGLEGIKFLQRMLKEIFHRQRPSELLTDFSYPSAHTARFAFCVALVLCVLLPRLERSSKQAPREASAATWWAAAAVSWIVMGSLRVLADAHWPSDTAGGACLGVSMAAAIDIVWRRSAYIVS